MRKMQFVLTSAVLAAVVCLSACGYALAGRGNSLPDHIRTIGIPNFTNQSRTPDLDHLLTEAVRAEFKTRGRYRIVPDSTNVDAVLTATIQPILLVPAEISPTGLASKYMVTVIASVEFTDEKEKKTFWSNPAFRLSDEYNVPNAATVPDPSVVFSADKNALERIARSFAQSLVTSILEAF